MKTMILTGILMAGALTAFAAVLDNFHNVPMNTFQSSRDDFKARGLGPSTFALYMDVGGKNPLVAGAFDAAHKDDVLRADMDLTDFHQAEQDNAKLGLSPREVSVGVFNNNVALLSTIFTKNPNATASEFDLTDSQFTAAYQKWVVQNGYRVLDHVQFNSVGKNLHEVTFVKDGKGFVFYAGLDEATFASEGTKLAAEGWEIDNFQVSLTPANTFVYSGVWLKKTDSAYQYFYSMSADQYQQHWNELTAQGYRVKKVFGYGTSVVQFGAIFVK